MSFAALRQHQLKATAFDTWQFAETVRHVPSDTRVAATAAVLIEHERSRGRSVSGADGYDNYGKIDETERIRVTVCRIADFEDGPITSITPGHLLYRAADSDTRPFVYDGETIAETPERGVYIFHRTKRFLDGVDR